MKREEFLRRLSVRLGHGAGALAPPAPHPAPVPPEALAGGAITARFVSRLEKLEVRVKRCGSRAEALRDVARLVAERGWHTVCGPASLRSDCLAGVWADDPRDADFGLAEANWAVAETGSVVFLNRGDAARAHSLVPPASGVLVAESRLLPRLGDALRALGAAPDDLPACVSIVSGPSNTADINATRCVGAHGPGEVFVWIVDEESSPA